MKLPLVSRKKYDNLASEYNILAISEIKLKRETVELSSMLIDSNNKFDNLKKDNDVLFVDNVIFHNKILVYKWLITPLMLFIGVFIGWCFYG